MQAPRQLRPLPSTLPDMPRAPGRCQRLARPREVALLRRVSSAARGRHRHVRPDQWRVSIRPNGWTLRQSRGGENSSAGPPHSTWCGRPFRRRLLATAAVRRSQPWLSEHVLFVMSIALTKTSNVSPLNRKAEH